MIKLQTQNKIQITPILERTELVNQVKIARI